MPRMITCSRCGVTRAYLRGDGSVEQRCPTCEGLAELADAQPGAGQFPPDVKVAIAWWLEARQAYLEAVDALDDSRTEHELLLASEAAPQFYGLLTARVAAVGEVREARGRLREAALECDRRGAWLVYLQCRPAPFFGPAGEEQ